MTVPRLDAHGQPLGVIDFARAVFKLAGNSKAGFQTLDFHPDHLDPSVKNQVRDLIRTELLWDQQIALKVLSWRKRLIGRTVEASATDIVDFGLKW